MCIPLPCTATTVTLQREKVLIRSQCLFCHYNALTLIITVWNIVNVTVFQKEYMKNLHLNKTREFSKVWSTSNKGKLGTSLTLYLSVSPNRFQCIDY